MTALLWLPLALRTRSQLLFDGILLTCIGTVQAFVTPHLFDAYPHITFFKFWLVHAGVIIGALYLAVVLGTRPRGYRAVLHYHIFISGSLLLSMAASYPLGANWSYSLAPVRRAALRSARCALCSHTPCAQPPTGSALDYLGPWPIYLVAAQLVCYPLFAAIIGAFALADKWAASSKQQQRSAKKDR